MEAKAKTVVISSHGLNTADVRIRHMLCQLRDEGVIVIDDTPVPPAVNPFETAAMPFMLRELLQHGLPQAQSKSEKLQREVERYLIKHRRTIAEEAELIRQKRSTLPAATRKYLMDVMYKPCP